MPSTKLHNLHGTERRYLRQNCKCQQRHIPATYCLESIHRQLLHQSDRRPEHLHQSSRRPSQSVDYRRCDCHPDGDLRHSNNDSTLTSGRGYDKRLRTILSGPICKFLFSIAWLPKKTDNSLLSGRHMPTHRPQSDHLDRALLRHQPSYRYLMQQPRSRRLLLRATNRRLEHHSNVHHCEPTHHHAIGHNIKLLRVLRRSIRRLLWQGGRHVCNLDGAAAVLESAVAFRLFKFGTRRSLLR